MIRSSGSGSFLKKWGCRGWWGQWGCRGQGVTEVSEAVEVSKAWKITTEDFRVILVLEFNNLRTKIILTESWKFLLNFSTFSIGGCWGQSMLLFWKLVDKTQISKPQDHTDNFKHNPISIFLSVRPKLLLTVQYEIPCTWISLTNLKFRRLFWGIQKILNF